MSKFKVGDRVENELYGRGTVQFISAWHTYAVAFDNPDYIDILPEDVLSLVDEDNQRFVVIGELGAPNSTKPHHIKGCSNAYVKAIDLSELAPGKKYSVYRLETAFVAEATAREVAV